VTTKNQKLVQEALKLFEADCARRPYTSGFERFVVSPENARDRLGAFIKGARRQLLIYDPQISDPAMLRLLAERTHAGVDLRVIGKVGGKRSTLVWEKYPGRRLHVRVLIRDGKRAFLGSQSLRRSELDKRREIGVFITDVAVVKALRDVFEQDWALTDSGRRAARVEESEKFASGAPAYAAASGR